jgi:gliding motility-associated-like protein
MKNILLLAFGLFLLIKTSTSQSLSQEILGSAGGYQPNNAVSVSWTLGEVVIETYSFYNLSLTQGFHQPDIKLTFIDDEFEFFNGFSPNGDGINDFWKIPFLINYPINKVDIINRWGDVVWSKENYNNLDIVFIGKNLKGEDLPDGTYYYSIEYNKFLKRGWVFIKR